MISDAPKAMKMGADLLEVRLDFLWTTEEKIRTTKISDEGEKEKVEVLVSKLDFEGNRLPEGDRENLFFY